MTLRKLYLLFIFVALIGCNQSDSNTTTEQESTQSQTQNNDNSTAEPEPERTGKVLARVNGTPIYEDDLNGRNLEFVITEEIIYQAGIKQGIDKEYRSRVRNFERNLVIEGTKAKILENAEPTKKISDEDIQKYYDLNKDRYTYVRIHEVSFPDVNLGKEIKEKVEKGEDLQEIANGYTDIAVTVTDIGFNKMMAKKFDNREVGSVSEVIQKPNGTFSVLKIVDVKDIPLNSSKKSIRHVLESVEKGQMFENYANTVAKENGMEIEIID